MSRQNNGAHLIESVLSAVRDVDDFDDLGLEALVEKVALAEFGLEIGGTGEDESSDVNLVASDEVLDGEFSDFTHVVVALLVTKTGETKGGLTTTTVLLREIDRELVDDFARVTGQSSEKGTVTVHDDESELGI